MMTGTGGAEAGPRLEASMSEAGIADLGLLPAAAAYGHDGVARSSTTAAEASVSG